MKKLFLIISVLVFLSPAFAKEDAIRLTVYNRGVAQVALVRQFSLVKGENWITFDDISEQILSETVSLKSLEEKEKITILQGDFLSNVVDLDKLWKSQIEHPVNLFTKEDTISGKLLRFDEDYFYLQTDQGGIRLVKRSEVENLSFPEIPEGVVVNPTLKFHLQSDRKINEADLELNYLTSGMSWEVYYKAIYSEGKVQLTGDFIVENKLKMGFDGAELSLIAGQPHMAFDKETLPRNEDMLTGQVLKTEGEPLFAYYVYPVTMKINLPPNDNKCIPLMEAKTFSAKEKYLMKEGFGFRNLETVISFVTSEIPLPAGLVGVYRVDKDGNSTFIGEDQLYDTPPGGEVEIKVGQAFDLQGERKRISHQRMNRSSTKDVIQVKLINGSDEDKEVVIRERLYGVWSIENSRFDGQSVEYTTLDSRRAEFKVLLKKMTTSTLEYTVKYEF